MKSVSDNFKSLAKKIRVQDLKIKLDEEEVDVKEVTYSFDSGLFETVMQQIEISGEDLSSIKDKNVSFSYGLYVDDAFEYIDMGSYYIKDLEDDKNKDVMTATGYDKMLNFMVTFDGDDLDITYPCTLLEFVQAMCDACNVGLYSTDFFNSDLTVDEDYYTAQSITYRDVLEQVAQATLTTIFIKDDKLYLCPINNSTIVQTLDKSYLKTLTIGEKFGELNSFVLGRGSVEDNIESRDDDSISENGKCEIRFDENDLLDSYREDVIDSMFEQIKGLTYYAIESTSVGCMWLEPCDFIAVSDRNDNAYYTYNLVAKVTINTGISASLDAEVPDTSTTTYSVTTDELKATLKVERLAKKNEGLIQDLIEATGTTEYSLSSTNELHLIYTQAGDDLISMSITGTMSAGTVTLVISDISRDSEEEATTTEIALTLSSDVSKITYEDGIFYGDGTALLEQTISLLDSNTYIYIKEYEELNYTATYTAHYSLQATIKIAVDTEKLISSIYMNADEITVDANKYLSLEAGQLIINSGNFLVDANGHVDILNGLCIKQTSANGAGLELWGTPPYIDFHYANSEDDYTSRIIEIATGVLEFVAEISLPKITSDYGNGYAVQGADDYSHTFQLAYDEDSEKIKFYVDGNQIASLSGDNTGDGSSSGGSSGGSGFPSTGTTTRTVFGIRREISSSSVTWERTDDAAGLTANATKNGTEVENDFDDYYPFSDIVTCNYDTEEREITAYLGDTDFTFEPEGNIEVMVLIPEFYWKRYRDDTYEYIKIATYEVDSTYTRMPTFMIGRYPTSGSSSRVHSRSGTTPLCSTTAENFRTYSRSLGDNWGELDIWHLAAIQMLYLVEYASYNCQSTVGNGWYTAYAQTSGGCDDLENKSGCLANSGANSVCYRGIEDLWGNVYYCIDGINSISYVPYVSDDPDNYIYDSSAEPYSAMTTNLASSNGWITKLSYDENYPSIMIPTAVGGSSSTYVPDYYYYGSGNRVLWVGYATSSSSLAAYAGLWYVFLYASSLASTDCGRSPSFHQ